MTAYYNEFDPQAAAWLRELIRHGAIAPGDVDERSIEDVSPLDLVGYTQCHFFAGIGGWSIALRLAGWPDDRPVWTGSCPCQPFSAAGKGIGFADERHLWPAQHHLLRVCRPAVWFGEQVDKAVGWGWLDLVQSDLEAEGYAVGAIDLPACSIGAPHIRNRLFIAAEDTRVASGLVHSLRARLEGHRRDESDGSEPGRLGTQQDGPVAAASTAGDVAHADQERRGTRIGHLCQQGREPDAGWGGEARGLANDDGDGLCGEPSLRLQRPDVHDADRRSPLGGFWSAAEWLPCRDGKWRPVEPGSFPLAHGVPARVGRLRGYGNAIVPPLAAEVIRAYAEGCVK